MGHNQMMSSLYHTRFVVIVLIIVGVIPSMCVGESPKGRGGGLTAEMREALMDKQVAQGAPLIPLSTTTYTQYVNTKRSYNVVLFFTANQKQRGCQMCTAMRPMIQQFAQSFYAAAKTANKKVFFFELDVDQAREVFGYHGFNSVPMIIFSKPMSQPWNGPTHQFRRSETFPMQNVREFQLTLQKWIADHLGLQVRMPAGGGNRGGGGGGANGGPTVSIEALQLVLYVGVFVTIAVTVYRVMNNEQQIMRILNGPWIWTLLACVVFFYMLSGTVWNAIRGTVLYHKHPYTGQVMYISPHFGHQFAAEGMIVAMLMLTASASIVALFALVPKISNRFNMQHVVGFFFMYLFYWSFAQVNEIYKFKNRGVSETEVL
eukprot:TRINITY_DN2609_c0_g2_i4.p1 TRINITY_DN2609_c0_g2~~TRINITY_DN2609_c0_g2_i4.p1  ORF type:complete len:374 (-),score=80.32 TRINITY_DN2609_c0_g2_i4:776-1897(-)